MESNQHQPKFLNNTFARLFDRNINFKFTKLLDGVNHLKDLTEYIILDYKINRNPQTSYRLLKEFDAVIKLFLTHFENYKMNEKEQKALVEMASKFKTDPIIAKIRFEGPNGTTTPENNKQSNGENTQNQDQKDVQPDEFTKIFDEMKKEFQEHRIENVLIQRIRI